MYWGMNWRRRQEIGSGGIARDIPEIDLGIGRAVAAAGRAIKAGLRAEIFERLD
jgi:hypothetical protein